MWRARAHAASARPDPGMAQATAATSRALRMPRSLGDSVALTEETVDPSFHYGTIRFSGCGRKDPATVY
eukprot:1878387-Rhodomonas_salina.2